jgi:hypothetical protein
VGIPRRSLKTDGLAPSASARSRSTQVRSAPTRSQ